MHLQMHLVHVLEIEHPIETHTSNAVLLSRIDDPTKFYLLMPHGHRPQYAVDMLNFKMERARRKYPTTLAQRDETTLPPQAQPHPPSRKRPYNFDNDPVFTNPVFSPKRKTSPEDWGFQNTPQTDKATHRLQRQLDYFIRPPGENEPPRRPKSDSL